MVVLNWFFWVLASGAHNVQHNSDTMYYYLLKDIDSTPVGLLINR